MDKDTPHKRLWTPASASSPSGSHCRSRPTRVLFRSWPSWAMCLAEWGGTFWARLASPGREAHKIEPNKAEIPIWSTRLHLRLALRFRLLHRLVWLRPDLRVLAEIVVVVVLVERNLGQTSVHPYPQGDILPVLRKSFTICEVRKRYS